MIFFAGDGNDWSEVNFAFGLERERRLGLGWKTNDAVVEEEK